MVSTDIEASEPQTQQTQWNHRRTKLRSLPVCLSSPETAAAAEVTPSNRFRGCLAGGVAANEWSRIDRAFRARWFDFGNDGPAGPASPIRTISESTQMTLLVASAVLAVAVQANGNSTSHSPLFRRSVAGHYLQWIGLNGFTFRGSTVEVSGWLQRHAKLFLCRPAHSDCRRTLASLEALAEYRRDSGSDGFGIGLTAPVAQLFAAHWDWDRDAVEHRANLFWAASSVASITNGHSASRLSAGAFAVILAEVLRGFQVAEAIESAKTVLIRHRNHAETLSAIVWAQRAATSFRAHAAVLRTLHTEHAAPRALAIALFAVLSTGHFSSALTFADLPGEAGGVLAPMIGHLTGARLGLGAIPQGWMGSCRIGPLLFELADDMLRLGDLVQAPAPSRIGMEFYRQKYPRI